jgi:hypothetical protein
VGCAARCPCHAHPTSRLNGDVSVLNVALFVVGSFGRGDSDRGRGCGNGRTTAATAQGGKGRRGGADDDAIGCGAPESFEWVPATRAGRGQGARAWATAAVAASLGQVRRATGS